MDEQRVSQQCEKTAAHSDNEDNTGTHDTSHSSDSSRHASPQPSTNSSPAPSPNAQLDTHSADESNNSKNEEEQRGAGEKRAHAFALPAPHTPRYINAVVDAVCTKQLKVVSVIANVCEHCHLLLLCEPEFAFQKLVKFCSVCFSAPVT